MPPMFSVLFDVSTIYPWRERIGCRLDVYIPIIFTGWHPNLHILESESFRRYLGQDGGSNPDIYVQYIFIYWKVSLLGDD